jgi:hypothetical protein
LAQKIALFTFIQIRGRYSVRPGRRAASASDMFPRFTKVAHVDRTSDHITRHKFDPTATTRNGHATDGRVSLKPFSVTAIMPIHPAVVCDEFRQIHFWLQLMFRGSGVIDS